MVKGRWWSCNSSTTHLSLNCCSGGPPLGRGWSWWQLIRGSSGLGWRMVEAAATARWQHTTQPPHSTLTQLLDVTPSTFMGIHAADLSISVTKANSFFIQCKYILRVLATRQSSRPDVCVHTNLISELFCSAFSGNKEYQEKLGTNHLGPGYCLVTQIILIVTSQFLFCNGIEWNLRYIVL